jgi:hypothetical protein
VLALSLGLAASGGDFRVVGDDDDCPSSSAPPLGVGVTSGLPLGLGVPLVNGLAVVTPRIVGDAVACGFVVAVARGVGDALPTVGSGEVVAAVEAVVAGDSGAPGLTWTVVLRVCADIEAITALKTASVAPNGRDVFTNDEICALE